MTTSDLKRATVTVEQAKRELQRREQEQATEDAKVAKLREEARRAEQAALDEFAAARDELAARIVSICEDIETTFDKRQAWRAAKSATAKVGGEPVAFDFRPFTMLERKLTERLRMAYLLLGDL
jgi:phage host-nuclease inhibitor protein Gam